ncbi:MAG: HD domain-containing protein [Oscillospiraceae bacterium]|nr:HD domain-containing protein [Oscillospiraceae bacterium]
MPKKPELLAVIDVGSNGLTLKIAQAERKGNLPRIIESVRGSLALGRDTYNEQVIREDNIVRLCSILLGFRQKLREYRLTQARVVATSAVREAGNRDYVTARIQQETGFSVAVLDNSQERYLHLQATASLFPRFGDCSQEGALLVDIGAGSLQVSSFYQGELYFSHNLMLGSLRVNEALNRLRDKAKDDRRLLDEYVSCELNDAYTLETEDVPYRSLIVIGSEIRALKKLAGYKRSDDCVEPRDAFKLLNKLSGLTPLTLTTQYGVAPDLAEVLLPSALIIGKYLQRPGITALYMPTVDLCDGLLLDEAIRQRQYHLNYNLEAQVVAASRHLARRFAYDKTHTDNVTGHALALFDCLALAYKLTPRMRLLLEVASVLHDIGKVIRLNDHSRQSFNMILSSDIPGLSDRERLMVAYIARQHSAFASPGKADMPELDENERKTVLPLGSILRLADGLDASHRQKLPTIRPRIRRGLLVIPLDTTEDTTLERSTARDKGHYFTQVFGLGLEFEINGGKL